MVQGKENIRPRSTGILKKKPLAAQCLKNKRITLNFLRYFLGMFACKTAHIPLSDFEKKVAGRLPLSDRPLLS